MFYRGATTSATRQFWEGTLQGRVQGILDHVQCLGNQHYYKGCICGIEGAPDF